MEVLAYVVLGLVALLHFWYLVLEMFLWQRPIGLKTFRTTKEFAQASAVLAANQGLYNGFLAAGLVWGAFLPDKNASVAVTSFFFVCISLAGIYGAFSVTKKLFYMQALPALIGLALQWTVIAPAL